MAKSVALSLFLATLGILFVKMSGIRDTMTNVSPTFFVGSLVGGIIFGAAMAVAGGCSSSSLWRAAEGQIKLWVVVASFALSNALFRYYMDEVWRLGERG